MLELAAEDPQFAKEQRIMCEQDMLYWINTYAWTYDPHKEDTGEYPVGPFVTYPFQDPALLQLEAAIGVEDIITNKSRDMGATWCHLLVFDWRWLTRDMESYLCVSRNEDYVDKRDNPKALFYKLDFINQRLPSWMLSAAEYKRSKGNLTNLRNGSVIDGEATTGDLAAGDRRTAILIDEFAKFPIKDGPEALAATRDVTRSRFFNSTPKRTGNAFFDLWTRGKMKQLALHWSKHPEKCRGLYKTDKLGGQEVLDTEYKYPPDFKPVCDGKLRSPWYDTQCERAGSDLEIQQELDMAFIGSGSCFFDVDLLNTLADETAIPPFRKCVMTHGPDMRTVEFVDRANGNCHLWIILSRDGKPPKDRKYAMGVDISFGMGATNSTIVICDIQTGAQVLEYADSHIGPTDWADIACALGWLFNDAFMVWDGQGGGGGAFRDEVILHGYTNIYFRRTDEKITRKVTDTPGHFWKGSVKIDVFSRYQKALKMRTYLNRSRQSLTEHQFYELVGNTIEHSGSISTQDPSGAKANHGDRVVAAVLCNVGMGERREKTPEEQGVAGPGTYGHLFAQRPKKPAESQWD